MNQQTLTYQDISFQIQLLQYLLSDRFEMLKKYQSDLIKHGLVIDIISELYTMIEKFDQELETLSITDMSKIKDTLQHLDNLFHQIRQLFSITSGVILATDWQSPSFTTTTRSQAGIQTGTIYQSINDYKRDQHRYGLSYEAAFRHQYIQSSFLNPVYVYATNSGMAALTTIIGFLQGEKITHDSIVCLGKHSYFENKLLIHHLFDQVVEWDETNLVEMDAIIKKHQPAAWFIDSSTNDAKMAQPDIVNSILHIKSNPNYTPYIVIDNTCQSIFLQPFNNHNSKQKNVIVWESLLKYHQFGLDKTNGGIIYTHCQRAIELYTYRDHLGTNISDQAVLTLPKPNRSLLEQKFRLHSRNRNLLANSITQWIQHNPNRLLKQVNPSNNELNSIPGSLLSLEFIDSKASIRHYQHFLKQIFKRAQQANISLIGGTSFGMFQTRLYIPASRPGQGVPFVRIATGIESYSQIQALADVFLDVLNSYT